MRFWRGRDGSGAAGRRPDAWEAIVDANVAMWNTLDDDEILNAVEAMDVLLSKRWEAAQGFVITDEHRVTIAAQASILAIALELSVFDDVPSIIVHPTTMRLTRPRAIGIGGNGGIGGIHAETSTVVGVAHDRRGPVLLAWDASLRGCRQPEHGHNVVLHEFAHKLDLLDRVIDGTPILDADLHARWVQVCTAEFERLRSGAGSVLDRYGATNPGEFFAVATEAFFCRATRLRDEHPDLYGVLGEFYGQDPARRAS